MELLLHRETTAKEVPTHLGSLAVDPASALDGPGLFVLAALRALHRRPAAGSPSCRWRRPPAPRGRPHGCRLSGGTAHNTQTSLFVGIDRPHSFRDDTQRN